jgi:hypothetical protein
MRSFPRRRCGIADLATNAHENSTACVPLYTQDDGGRLDHTHVPLTSDSSGISYFDSF